MSSNRRDRRFSNNYVAHITNRIERGLPLLRCPYINLLIWSALARAQYYTHCPVAAVQLMGNHFHLILFRNGKKVSLFMNIFEGELAKYVKRLYGDTYTGRIWERRFSEQRLATPRDVLDMMSYIFLNPARANLVESVQQWEGVGSWNMMVTGSKSRSCPWVPPRVVGPIQRKPGVSEYRKLLHDAKAPMILRIDPFGWLDCFPEIKGDCNWQEEKVRAELISKVKKEEKLLSKARQASQRSVKTAAHDHWISPEYRPDRGERTPFLICHDKWLRIELIQSYRDFCRAARAAYERIRDGEHPTKVHYPPGAFHPSGVIWDLEY